MRTMHVKSTEITEKMEWISQIMAIAFHIVKRKRKEISIWKIWFMTFVTLPVHQYENFSAYTLQFLLSWEIIK